MADLSASCRKRGLRLGVYLSPQDHAHGAGGGGRCRTPHDQQRYDRIYRQQLTELLTRYGKISEVWFDGGQVVDVADILREHASDAVVFQGPQMSIRWVGNEDGFAPYPCWNSVSAADARTGVATAAQGNPDGTVWLPCECDTKIRGQWHWASDNTRWGSASLKSLDVLLDTYYRSVGHGQVLLLNHSPDPSGRIREADFRRGAELGAEIRRRFGRSLAETSGRGSTIELDLGGLMAVDHVVTMEDIAHGERVRSYVIHGYRDGQWTELAAGTAIGHKKIDRFAAAEVEKIRFRTTAAVETPVIRRLAAYYVGSQLTPAVISGSLSAKRIEVSLGLASDDTQRVDLSRWISEPGQYELILRGGDGNLPDLKDLRLLIDDTDAGQYLTASEGQPGRFNVSITVTRSWPPGTLILERVLHPPK